MNERTALITGASSGIGRALARRLSRRGTTVFLCARRDEVLRDLRADIAFEGGRAEVVPLDVSDPGAVVEAVRKVDAACDGLDLVVANAGVGAPFSGKHMTWEHVAPVLQVNVIGAISTLTAALPAMIERKRGHLVGISSLAGRRGLPMSAHYSASKAALSTFLESLRIDLFGTGVDVTDVRPGFVDSDLSGPRSYATPMLMRLDVAVRQILEAIDGRVAVAAFPLPMAAALGASRLLPRALYDTVLRRVTRPATSA